METKDLKYTGVLSGDEIKYIGKLFSSYILTIILWIYTINVYKAWGTTWILPSVSAMWIMGAVTARIIAEERESTIKQTKYAIIGYTLMLIMYRIVIQLVVPVTSSQMGASLNISSTSASGMAAAGMLQNMLIWISIMVPVGFLGWCAQKFKVYRGRNTKAQEFEKLKGFNANRRRR